MIDRANVHHPLGSESCFFVSFTLSLTFIQGDCINANFDVRGSTFFPVQHLTPGLPPPHHTHISFGIVSQAHASQTIPVAFSGLIVRWRI